jgi:phage terminase large subunit-like protein
MQAKRFPILRIVAATFADARDVCIEGESGLKRICGPDEIVTWNRSMGEGEFRNGARFKIFSGAEPERLRGPQSYADWYDELRAWPYIQETWDMAMLGLRLGRHPRAAVTTTSRPHALFRKLQERPDVHITRGSTHDNKANLAETFFQNIVNQYEGTRLGRQELYAELLDDTPGALWQRAQIDAQRTATVPKLTRIIVAVDPSATSSDTSDEAGIVAAGRGTDNHGYTLEDRTLRGTPLQWAREAIAMYHRLKANEIVAEANNGGEMVRTIIQSVDPGVPVRLVWAAQGKQTRAEPVSMLYEQGRAHHVGTLPALEDEMCSWTPYDGKSPNRIDALVWAYYGLGLTETGKVGW